LLLICYSKIPPNSGSSVPGSGSNQEIILKVSRVELAQSVYVVNQKTSRVEFLVYCCMKIKSRVGKNISVHAGT
jgi:hypothetical protein